jgi:hypothetical protein
MTALIENTLTHKDIQIKNIVKAVVFAIIYPQQYKLFLFGSRAS